MWSQLANVLIRKTQVASILTWDRLFKNRVMLYSFAFEIGLINIFIFAIGDAFLLKGDPLYCSVGLWVIPLILIWDETRKYLCRAYPDGWLRKYSNF